MASSSAKSTRTVQLAGPTLESQGVVTQGGVAAKEGRAPYNWLTQPLNLRVIVRGMVHMPPTAIGCCVAVHTALLLINVVHCC
jgi:hypothetical protein